VSNVMPGFRPAKRAGLSDEVVASIRQAIFDGVFKVGDRLGEAEIAHQLDVSRGPVREALVLLRQEGLVSTELHRGASVVQLSINDLLELTTLRTTLETFAIERAATHATPEDLAGLEAVIREMEQAVAADDEHKLTQLDIKFHDGIYQAAKHARLTNAWNSIRSQMLLFLLTRAAANRDYLTIAVAEHSQLLDYIRAGDVKNAVAEIAAHASGAYDRLVLTYPIADRATFPTLDDETAAPARAE